MNNFISIFLAILLSNITSSSYDKLADLIYYSEKNTLNENEYYSAIKEVNNNLKTLERSGIEPLYPYEKLPNYRLLISEFGPGLYYLRNSYMHNVKSLGDYRSLLGLSMLQDETTINVIIGKIMTASESSLIKFDYIKLLALYGSKAIKTKAILSYIQSNEWYLPIKKLIPVIVKSIDSDEASSPWKRYKLWKKLSSLNSNLACDSYKQDLIIEQSTVSEPNSLKKSDLFYLSNINYSADKILKVWKNKGLFKYIIKLKGSRGKLIGIDINNKVHTIKNSSNLDVFELFVVEDRVFLVAALNHMIGEKYIEEITWNYSDRVYMTKRLFTLGINYTKLVADSKYFYIEGSDWKYKINKKNAVIESATLCGENVVINQAL